MRHTANWTGTAITIDFLSIYDPQNPPFSLGAPRHAVAIMAAGPFPICKEAQELEESDRRRIREAIAAILEAKAAKDVKKQRGDRVLDGERRKKKKKNIRILG